MKKELASFKGKMKDFMSYLEKLKNKELKENMIKNSYFVHVSDLSNFQIEHKIGLN